MNQTFSPDPRAIRTRAALAQAFKELMRIMPYKKISITEITERAGIARHTFYNHYETKADLLNNIIDSILDPFFLRLEKWDLLLADPAQEQAMLTAFFQTWRDHTETIDLLKSVDIEFVIMERLKVYFARFFYETVTKEMPAVDLELAKYMISFNAYSLLGLLIPWFKSGMHQDPKDLAGFYNQLAGTAQRRRAIENYQDIFR